MVRSLALTAVVLASLVPLGTALAQPSSELGDLSLEELLEVEVVTASRYSQQLKDSPMSVTVLTADRIRESGARNIPEALRLVQGLEVTSATNSSADVSARGYNHLASNAVLVLIDGRSVYHDIYGVTVWDLLPIGLVDIHSIEIVRGPVSSLYGANAFAGVINIRTVSAAGRSGSEVSARSGFESNSVLGTVAQSGRWSGFDTRLSLGFGQETSTLANSGAGSEIARLNFKAERVNRAGRRLELSGGFTDGYVEMVLTPVENGGRLGATTHFLMADWSGSQGTLRAFWNRSDVELNDPEESNSQFTGAWVENVVDVEAQRSKEAGDSHRLLVGAHARLQTIDSDLGEPSDALNLALFANDEWTIAGPVIASLGVRADHHPITGLQYSPRASVLFRLGQGHQLRLLGGSSYRNPSYLETHWNQTYTLLPGFPITVRGSKDLDAERIRSVELGLQSLWTPSLMTSVHVYHSQLRDVSDIVNVSYHPSPPAPIPGIPSVTEYANADEIDVTGLEWSADYWASDWMQITANGSVVESTDPKHGNRPMPEVPRYRNTLGVRVDPGETWLVHLWMRHVSESTWEYIRGLMEYETTVGDYVVLDARLAFRLSSQTEFAVTARNLLDHSYQEYGAGHVFGARVLASLHTRF